jgi:hypothetical protein
MSSRLDRIVEAYVEAEDRDDDEEERRGKKVKEFDDEEVLPMLPTQFGKQDGVVAETVYAAHEKTRVVTRVNVFNDENEDDTVSGFLLFLSLFLSLPLLMHRLTIELANNKLISNP